MGKSSMTMEDLSAKVFTERKTCCKCGDKLERPGVSGYCGTCRWLLHCDNADPPTDAKLVELGLFVTTEEKQRKEAIPILDGVSVAEWPEVRDPKLDRRKRKRQPGIRVLSCLDEFFQTL